MRKFLTALLAVLMLVAVVVPVAAADEEVIRSSFDGTTEEYSNNVNLSLVVTEMMSNSTNSMGWTGDQKAAHKDAFTYLEVYNRGLEPIDLTDIAIVSYANNRTIDDAGKVTHEFYQGTFEKKFSINAGNIYANVDGVTAAVSANKCVNPQAGTAIVEPGEFGIIWIWTADTIEVDTKRSEALGMPYTGPETNGLEVSHYWFRKHYNMPANNEIPIVALYGMTLTKGTQTIYGLVKDEEVIAGDTSKNFQIATPTFQVSYDTEGNATYTYPANNNNILCMWQWGTATGAGLGGSNDLTTEDTDGGTQFFPSTHQGKATIFVPAACSPDYYNAKALAENDEFVAKKNYVDIDGTYVFSFREMAIFSGFETSTLGAMDAVQWAYVDPDRCPADVKNAVTVSGTQTWQEAAIAKYIEDHPISVEEDGGNRTETQIKINFKDRSELGNKGQNQQQQNVTEEKGLPVWALILIIVGGVVLLAGVAVVVIIVVKKKKPVAADDVAAEGEVLIVDETEGAAEEAPATEEKTEE